MKRGGALESSVRESLGWSPLLIEQRSGGLSEDENDELNVKITSLFSVGENLTRFTIEKL